MLRRLAPLALLLLATPALAADQHVDKTVPFAFNTWTDLGVTEGPVTLHRIRIVELRGAITKSDLFRPGNTEYLENVEIQLEYTNTATDDWDAHMDITWLDDAGRVIDGYRDDESLSDDSRHKVTTVKLSTLKYGIERAKTFSIKIRVEPD